jgi:hypothetical protein
MNDQGDRRAMHVVGWLILSLWIIGLILVVAGLAEPSPRISKHPETLLGRLGLGGGNMMRRE